METVVPDVVVSPMVVNAWSTRFAERWSIGRHQNGGVLLSAVSAALAAAAGHPHPFAVSGHYLRPTEAGDAVVQTALVKQGRTYSTAVGQLWQADRERLQVTGSFGDLTARTEMLASYSEPAPVPGRRIARVCSRSWRPGR